MGHNQEPVRGDAFYNHRPTEDCAERLAEMRAEFRALRDKIRACCPDCREKSMAVSELQKAMNLCIAAIVITDPGSVAVL